MRAMLNGTKIGHATSSSLDKQLSVTETSSKDTGDGAYTESTANKLSWSLSVEFLFNLDETISSEARLTYADLEDAQESRAPVPLELSTGVVGDYKRTGNVIVTALSSSFPNDENASATATLTGTGPLTRALIAA